MLTRVFIREGEYPTPVRTSVEALEQVYDLHTVVRLCKLLDAHGMCITL